ncbi:MAG TPA: hypothetical protein VJX66_23005 [Amycolatopsis sp.]|nr:hypothetical protein [Amycolatopsis sp.]
MRRRLGAAKRFSWTGFTVTVAASLLGALVPSAIGAGASATLITTVVTTLLAAGGLTASDGTARGVKAVAIVLLAAGAVILTVTGVTVLDLVRGVAVTSGRTATFPVVPDADTTPTQEPTQQKSAPRDPGIDVPSSVACPDATIGTETTCTVSVRSVGTSALQVTSTELSSDAFKVDDGACVGKNLVPGKKCALTVRFTPPAEGESNAELTIHQNLAGPASSVTLTGRGLPASTPVPTSSDAPAG